MFPLTPFKFVLHTLKPFKIWTITVLFFYAIPALDTAIKPYIIKIILDRVQTTLPQNAFDALWVPITCFVGLSLFVVIIYRLIDYAWMYLNPGVKCYAGDLLMQRMMLHSHQLYQEHFTGSIAARIKEVMSGIPDLIKLIGDGFFSYLIILPTSVYIIAQIHPFLSWTLAIWLVIFISLSYLLAKGVKKYAADSAKARSKTMGAFVDILGNIMSVRLFSAKKFEQDYLAGFLDEYYTADTQRDWYTLKMFALLGVSFVIYISVSCFWLINTFSKGQVTVGDFALVLSLSITLMERLWNFSKDIGKLSDLVGTLTQSLKLILSPIQIANQDNAPDLDIKEGTIDFKNVQFSYEENKPLFQNKTVKIRSGEKVGLVGYSGSGKSTFVHLILRLFDVNEGRILIDGQDIKDVSQESLRKSIGFIPQDPSLFHRSLLENIRYGSHATEDEVIEAAKKAFAHEFILTLPKGYASLVGERGVKLSGGQRQRIAIARAFLKNAPILILDEATSQLDSVTEDSIQDSLRALMQEKTTIIIAHRLSTLLQMDRILVFDKGQIVQDGTHNQLLKQPGQYQILWNAQVGGFLPEHQH
jgi:ATP-binding cassette, subfamily B, bacterial